MYERFLTEAARIEHRQALELTARRGWLLPAKPSIAKKLAARIRALRRGHNPIELVTQATTTTALVAAPAREGRVATAAAHRPVTSSHGDTDMSTTEPGTDRVGAFGGRSDEIVNVARVAGSPR